MKRSWLIFYHSICGNDYNSDGKCFSGSDGLDMPYQYAVGKNHLRRTLDCDGGRLLYQLWTYDKSQKFLFKMENFFKSEKVAEK